MSSLLDLCYDMQLESFAFKFKLSHYLTLANSFAIFLSSSHSASLESGVALANKSNADNLV